jgi:vacuolar-type H+-ATPase subunit I/STV1
MYKNLNNATNVIGMGNLLADDDDEEIDIDEIEKSISSGIAPKRKSDTPVDIAKEYSKEIEDLSKRFNIKPTNDNTQTTDDNTDDRRDIDDLLNWEPYKKPDVNHSKNNGSSTYKAPYNLDDDDESDDKPKDTKTWSANDPDDEQLNTMTNEERKQKYVNKVLDNFEKNDDEAEFVQQADEEDEMAKIIEQIDLLRTNLDNEGVNLERIPDVDVNTSKKEARSVLKILQIKNDRLRYCDFFEEVILAGAYGLENIFNGKREIFGSNVDLTGYSDTVKVKLRRMRYDTSNFVSSVMQGYNISSGWRIMLELVPSLFLYSRDRRLKANDNLMSDDAYHKAMQELS